MWMWLGARSGARLCNGYPLSVRFLVCQVLLKWYLAQWSHWLLRFIFEEIMFIIRCCGITMKWLQSKLTTNQQSTDLSFLDHLAFIVGPWHQSGTCMISSSRLSTHQPSHGAHTQMPVRSDEQESIMYRCSTYHGILCTASESTTRR